jgi:hypothetical protein
VRVEITYTDGHTTYAVVQPNGVIHAGQKEKAIMNITIYERDVATIRINPTDIDKARESTGAVPAAWVVRDGTAEPLTVDELRQYRAIGRLP